MTVLASTGFEAGTNGAAPTAATSGFDALSPTTPTTSNMQFTNSNVAHGALALAFVDTANPAYGIWTTSVGTTTEHYGRAYVYFTANGASSKRIVIVKDSTGAQSFAIHIASGTTPKIGVRNSANTLIATMTAGMTLSTIQRIEWHNVNGGASGQIEIRLFAAKDDTTPAGTIGPLTGFSNGSNCATYQVGMIDSTGFAITMDDVAIGDAAGGWIGPVTSTAASGTATITLTGSAAGPAPAATATLTLSGSAAASASAPAGTATITLTGTATPTTAISQWLALPTAQRNVAHRAGENDFPEMTMYGYAQCVAFNSQIALNVDGWLTSDGVLIASHDQTADRVFGTTGFDFTQHTWAEAQQLRTLSGNQPPCRVKDVLDTYGASRVIFIENKQGTAAQAAFNTLLSSYPTATTNFIWKSSYGGTNGLASAKAAGAVGAGWGYFFPAANGDPTTVTPANMAPWDLLGIEYDAPASDWSTALGTGKVVLAHVIQSQANATQASTAGAQGLMTAKILGVVPADRDTAAATITLTGTAGASARPAGAATVTITGSGNTSGGSNASGSATVTITGTAGATSRASGTATVTITGYGTPPGGLAIYRLTSGSWVPQQIYRLTGGTWVPQTIARL